MNDTKAKILHAAEELISEKGVAGTTIAQIAARANVSDSLAYLYFKDKEDLVFAVARHRLMDTWNQLQEQLQGIADVRSQLSKIIWFGLKYNCQHRDYVRNLMFTYRSNKKFYLSEAYEYLYKHSAQTLQVLNRGVEEGLFNGDVNMRLVREIIYGTLDFEAVSSVITGEIEDSSEDWRDIMALLQPMIENRSPAPFDKKLRVLFAAEKLFAEKGFQGAIISDIAKLAEVAEGTVYDLFKNKENLLLSLTDFRLKSQIELLPETFEIQSPLRKLRRFIRFHFDLYLQNRDFLQIFVLENLLNQRFYASGAFAAYRSSYLSVLENIVTEGKAQGIFRAEVNVRVFRNMFLGAFAHMTLRWIVFAQHNFDKMKEIDQLIDLLCQAVVVDDPT